VTHALKLDPAAAFLIWLELLAAWPCPPGAAAGVGWPSNGWRIRYMKLRQRLAVVPAKPAPPAEEVAAELWSLQCELRDAQARAAPAPDTASQWENSFARLGRAGRIIDHYQASQAGERGR